MASMISVRKPSRGEISIPEMKRSSSSACRFCGSAITMMMRLPSRTSGSAQFLIAALRGIISSTAVSTVANRQST